YGVQNAPETVSAFVTTYDPIATHWDAAFGLNVEEREGFKALVYEVTDGNPKCRTLDLGAGTGAALDLEITDAFRLTAVDPSGPMLNLLVRKHPLVARVEPMPFQVARDRRVLAGTSFDLVLALGGSGSYLTDEDWIALPDHAKGRYVISVFAEGEWPVTGDLSTDEISRARENAASFASTHGGRIERVGRFDVAVAHA
ncbi:MAG: class I SAM-dependent methyltransferase, partial [Fimbriimonadaceae bacterium]|nr:class I SAM-dependent methyltransferase [Fimbriimonadaceae bacterium]